MGLLSWRSRSVGALLSAAAPLALGGCGLELSGTMVLSESPDGGADGGIHAENPAVGETSCLDGVDNDGDGTADCADPKCSTVVRCAPASPSGWGGDAVYSPDRVACPGAYSAVDTFEGLDAPAVCSACTCGAPSTASCAAITQVHCDNGKEAPTKCTAGGSVVRDVPLDGACHAVPATAIDDKVYCQLDAPAGATGACTAGGGQAPRAKFTRATRVCTSQTARAAGCGAGEVCMPRVPRGFHGRCVGKFLDRDAPVACPAGFPVQRLLSPEETSFVDGRTCTPCGCAAPTNVTCGASATSYTSNDCSTGPLGAVASTGACVQANTTGTPVTVRAVRATATVTGGACTPSGGQPSGAAAPSLVTEWCCED